MLEHPKKILIDHSLRFEFIANNNHVEYKDLSDGMNLSREMGALNLRAHNESQLITSMVSKEYHTK